MIGGPSIAYDEHQYHPKCDGQMIEEIHEAPKTAFLAIFFDDAEDVHECDDDESNPAEDGAMRAVVEGRVNRKHS